MEDGIGCKEFARIVGASYPEVSRAASAGLLRVVGTRGNRRGPGVHILDREEAYRIATAVKCGIPWRVAATVSDRIRVIKGGGIRVIPPATSGRGVARAILHRSHGQKIKTSSPTIRKAAEVCCKSAPAIDADQH